VIAAAAPAAALQLRPINHDIFTAGVVEQNEVRRTENAAAIKAYISSKQKELGENIVVVFPALSTTQDNRSVTVWLAASANGPIGVTGGTQAATTDAAQAWAVSAGAEVIVLP
jgi:hypothetical protein